MPRISLMRLAKLHRKLPSVFLLMGSCTVLLLGEANAAESKRISGRSPFAACVADQPSTQEGTLYPDTEIEPWIEINPAQTNNLIAGWQQDRWSNGGARGLAAGVSIDGGKNWATVVPPKVTKCSGGKYDRASDPWIAIGPAGVAHFVSLAFMRDRPDGGIGQNAILVSRSLNGGMSWGNPATVMIDTSGQILNDKESMKADPTDHRFVYVTWDRLQDFGLPRNSAFEKHAADLQSRPGDGAELARERRRFMTARAGLSERAQAPVFFKGPTYFTRTADGGSTWEIPRKIYDPGNNSQTINNVIEVLPNGTLLNFFTNIDNDLSGSAVVTKIHLGYVSSSDKGKSFGDVQLPIEMNVTFSGTRTPDFREPVRDANILFDTAVDHDTGNLYVVWQDGRWGNIDRIAFSMSSDRGVTWTKPIRVNMTPQSATRLRNQAFVPSVAVGKDHQVAVTYYDFRNDRSGAEERVDYFAVFCTPSDKVRCDQRRSWGDGRRQLRDKRITRESFNILDAPVAGGHFLGDYMGLVPGRQGFIPAFGIAHGHDRVSINSGVVRSD